MTDKPSKRALAIAVGAVVALAGLVAYLVFSIPAVEGLGTKVKLPIFHGASTWVDLMLFALLGVVAVAYLVTKREGVYAWEVGLRAIAAPLWAVNSVLGLVAALNTWDFTGSKESPFVAASQDPRLMAQLILLLGVAMVLLLDWLVLDKHLYKAIVDVAFVGAASVLLGNIFLDPAKAALHPNSPVLNSGWDIKGPFLGIVVALFAITLIGAWIVRRFVRPEPNATAPAEAAPEQS